MDAAQQMYFNMSADVLFYRRDNRHIRSLNGLTRNLRCQSVGDHSFWSHFDHESRFELCCSIWRSEGLGVGIFCNNVGVADEMNSTTDKLFLPRGTHEFAQDGRKFRFSTLLDLRIARGDGFKLA